MSEPRAWCVAFYQDEHGNRPVELFLDRLQAQDRDRVYRYFDWLRRFGVDLDMPHTKHLSDDLWELRPGDLRILYYLASGHRFVLLNAFRKQTDKTPGREMRIAERRMADHRRRTGQDRRNDDY